MIILWCGVSIAPCIDAIKHINHEVQKELSQVKTKVKERREEKRSEEKNMIIYVNNEYFIGT